MALPQKEYIEVVKKEVEVLKAALEITRKNMGSFETFSGLTKDIKYLEDWLKEAERP